MTPADLAALPLPGWLRMNIRVVDAQDGVLAEGRDLAALKRKVLGTSAMSARKEAEDSEALHRQWDFGELPVSRQIERNGLLLTVYPAIADRRGAVTLVEARGAFLAEEISRRGVGRLALLALPQQARYWHKRVREDRELVFTESRARAGAAAGGCLVQRIFLDAFVAPDAPLPRSREAFIQRLDAARAGLEEAGTRLVGMVRSVLTEWRAVHSRIDGIRNPASLAAISDINTQLAMLLPPDFIESTPHPWLGHLPRYLKAIVRRLERLPAEARRDEELAARVRPFMVALETLRRAGGGRDASRGAAASLDGRGIPGLPFRTGPADRDAGFRAAPGRATRARRGRSIELSRRPVPSAGRHASTLAP